MSDLPQSALSKVEMLPIEDLLLPLLRQGIPDVPIQTLIADDQTFPFILVRSAGAYGRWDGDERFVDSNQVQIHCLCTGLDADEDAALLSEVVRVVLRDSVNKVVPGKGHITECRLLYKARRVPDWATATGPVQYADLPTGVTRYESVFYLETRRPLTKPFS